jgi:hypothetical protein
MHRALITLALLFAPAVGWCAERPGSPAAAGLVPPNAPKSTFVDEPGFGCDPFFPNSDSRKASVQVPDTDHGPSVPAYISLKGISISQGRKLAIINNYTLAEGEEFTLRYGGQAVRVKCLEIKERLVLIQVNGATKELPLRNGF